VGRLILVRRIAQGRPVAHVAGEMGVSRATAYKWWHRCVDEGEAGLHDRGSRPLRSPLRTSARVEQQIVRCGDEPNSDLRGSLCACKFLHRPRI